MKEVAKRNKNEPWSNLIRFFGLALPIDRAMFNTANTDSAYNGPMTVWFAVAVLNSRSMWYSCASSYNTRLEKKYKFQRITVLPLSLLALT